MKSKQWGLAQQRYVKSHRNLFRSPRSGPHPGTPYRPIRMTGVGMAENNTLNPNPRPPSNINSEPISQFLWDAENPKGSMEALLTCRISWQDVTRSDKYSLLSYVVFSCSFTLIARSLRAQHHISGKITFRTGLPPWVINDESHEAASRTQSSLWGTFIRRSVRHVCCSPMFPSVLPLGSTNSAPSRPGLFAGFIATMKRSDFSCPCVIGFDSSPSRCGPL